MSPYTFTRSALRELDRRAVQQFHIPIPVLMENAGSAVAETALHLLKKSAAALILAGPGNNGGDGLVAARHLHNANIPIQILLYTPPTPKSTSLSPQSSALNPFWAQLQTIEAMRLPLAVISPNHAELRDYLVDSNPHDLIIDALFGTGLSRPVTGLPHDIIAALNASRRPILSLDIPSGLDCDTGLPLGIAVKAAHTLSLCGSKLGFQNPAAIPYLGKLTTAGIGIPRELLAELAVK